jgi:hypothetical protein
VKNSSVGWRNSANNTNGEEKKKCEEWVGKTPPTTRMAKKKRSVRRKQPFG